jgi:2-polyprenyl-3-methyl-5-hydroxy-6-metoxy-1,4-benzoquinol methylase
MFNKLIYNRLKTMLYGLIKRYGNSFLRARIWDKEFHSGRWDYLDSTKEDYIYEYLKRYIAGGNILDLGCGGGNTSVEIEYNSYSAYLGVDISKIAINKARKRSEIKGRSQKNQFVIGDIITFLTNEKYDVILFRESIHYFPIKKIVEILNKYKNNLTDRGVFIVRLCDRLKYRKILYIIRKNFRVLVEHPHPTTKAIIIIFK